MNYERTLTEVSRNLLNAVRARPRGTVDVDTAKVVRTEMARAGRIVTELIRNGRIETPADLHPWLALALSERGGFWDTQLRGRRGTLSTPIDDHTPPFTVYSDESVVHWIAHEQHRADGSDYPSIEDAVRSQIVHRHVLLEATTEWLWKMVEFCRPDLVLPVWTVWVVDEESRHCICLCSDWHEPFSKDLKHSGLSEIALACATACASLCSWLRTSYEACGDSSCEEAVRDRDASTIVAKDTTPPVPPAKARRGRKVANPEERQKVDEFIEKWTRLHPGEALPTLEAIAEGSGVPVDLVQKILARRRAAKSDSAKGT